MPRQYKAKRTKPSATEARRTKQEALFAQEQLFCFQLELLGNPKFVASDPTSKIKAIQVSDNYQIGRAIPNIQKGRKNIYQLLGTNHLVAAARGQAKDPNEKEIQETFLRKLCKSERHQEDFDRERISAFGFHPRNLNDDVKEVSSLSDLGISSAENIFAQIVSQVDWKDPSKKIQQKHLQVLNGSINDVVWKKHPLRKNIERLRMDKLSDLVGEFQDLLPSLPQSEAKALGVFEEAVTMAVQLIRLFYNHPDTMLDLLHTVWDLFSNKRRRMAHRIKIGSTEYTFLHRLEMAACGFVFTDYLTDEHVDFWKQNIEVMTSLALRFFEIGDKEWLVKLHERYFRPTIVLIEYHVSEECNFNWNYLKKCERTFQNYIYLAAEQNRCCECSGFVVKDLSGSQCSSCSRIVHYECSGCEYPTKNSIVRCPLHQGHRVVEPVADHAMQDTKQGDDDDDDEATETETETESENGDDSESFEIVVHESEEFLAPSDTDEEMHEAPPPSSPPRGRGHRSSSSSRSRATSSPCSRGILEHFGKKQVLMLKQLGRLENAKVVGGEELQRLYFDFNAYKHDLFPLMDTIYNPRSFNSNDDNKTSSSDELGFNRFVATTTPYHVIMEIQKQEETVRVLGRQIQELEQQKRSLMGWLDIMENEQVVQIDGCLSNVEVFGRERGMLMEIEQDVMGLRGNLREVVEKVTKGISSLSDRQVEEQSKLDEMKLSARSNQYLSRSKCNMFCDKARNFVREMNSRTSRVLQQFSRQIKQWTLNDFEIWLQIVGDGKFASYAKNEMENVDGTRGFYPFLTKECDGDLLLLLHSWGVSRWSDRETLQDLLALILGR